MVAPWCDSLSPSRTAANLDDPIKAFNPSGDRIKRTPTKSGDYNYLRVEQLDSNLAWSSPVWIN
ncbi:MAG: hypothetical protein GY953_29660 [bacterium]|nr:hypothetical protein [bacterium]